MFLRFVTSLAFAMGSLTGCASDPETDTPAPAVEQEREQQAQPGTPDGQVPAECTPSIRFKGVVYNGLGYTRTVGAQVGTADEAECRDVTGEGTVFTDTSPVVPVHALPGYSTADALTVAVDESLHGVYVASTVPPAEREAISQQLVE